MMADGAPKALEMHPAADLFPRMHGPRFEELKEDIRKRGLIHKIVLCEGKVLDGRNRQKACKELSEEPGSTFTITDASFTTYTGNPYDYVWSANGERRDLQSELQRYLIWCDVIEHSAEWEELFGSIQAEGNRKRSEASKETSREQPREDDGTWSPGSRADSSATRGGPNVTRMVKAEASNTNVKAVQNGDQLLRDRPDLARKVQFGEMKPAEAMRQLKKDQVHAKIATLPDGKFRVVYADPPWKYNDTREGLDMDGLGNTAAEAHYPTMTMEEIKALDVKALVADDAVLFMWATFPLMPSQLEVPAAWGFTFKTAFVWNKQRGGFGHYHKAELELLIVATRGSCVPENDKRFNQLITAQRGRHSSKPEIVREMIDAMYPSGPRIELFFRGEKPPSGWKVWGAEAEDGKGCGEAASASIPPTLTWDEAVTEIVEETVDATNP
jgi:N6-adenosine-specific RNA methylase IME4